MKDEYYKKLVAFIRAMEKEVLFRKDKNAYRSEFQPPENMTKPEIEQWLRHNWKAEQKITTLQSYYQMPYPLNELLKYTLVSDNVIEFLHEFSFQVARVTPKSMFPQADECLDIDYEENEDAQLESIPRFNNMRLYELIDDKEEFPVILEINGFCTAAEFRKNLSNIWKKEIKPALDEANRRSSPVTKAGKYCRDRVYRESLFKSAQEGKIGTAKELNKIVDLDYESTNREFQMIRNKMRPILESIIAKKRKIYP